MAFVAIVAAVAFISDTVVSIPIIPVTVIAMFPTIVTTVVIRATLPKVIKTRLREKSKKLTSPNKSTRTGCPRRSLPSSSFTARSASSRLKYSRMLISRISTGNNSKKECGVPLTGGLTVNIGEGNVTSLTTKVLEILCVKDKVRLASACCPRNNQS
jgi:hypothetical protein